MSSAPESGALESGPLEPGTVLAAFTLELEHEAVPAEQVVSGSPTTGVSSLCRFDESEIGVWEMTPGAMSDVESDEVFVVIAGKATVQFEHDDSVVRLAPGTVGRLSAGQRTVWTVTETLRKIYIA